MSARRTPTPPKRPHTWIAYRACGAKAALAFPRFVPPCLPTLRQAPPRGPEWCHEVKFDGWRLQLHKAGERVRLLSRHGHDLTTRFPAIAAEVASLDAETAVLEKLSTIPLQA